ncbi:radical SAM protein [Hymenobacter weizhouensis]|uniref:radical SAM protein n=1 Tax=Hymenobacter sp. YIM 151500-1 TaxID=2987689 RepID=UPI0022275E78|nr:radical SAM protein [Hymenobacter sp. YIM 151500-1]UYZ64360.1 radical SAM protein [Hymenobacter sp. YIM 151500-1]
MIEQVLIPELHYLPAAAPAESATAVPAAALPPTVVQSGWRRAALRAVFGLVDFGTVLRYLHRPGQLRQAVRQIRELRRQYYGPLRVRKVARVAGRYYREFQTPGWPSAAYTSFLATTLHRLVPFRAAGPTLQMVFLAITKKCPLACEHCFEWDALNQREKLSVADVHSMVREFQARGVTQILFSGGEPMLRMPDLLAVLRQARPGTDFWVFTSGFHFTAENARQLRQAGLTGVSISLDHHDPARHNAFRGSGQAFAAAVQAAVHAHAAGLVVCLTLCATREFTTEANLLAYARLARHLGATFIHVLEPRATGHYAGQDVDLSPAQLTLLEEFYHRLNQDDAYLDWPIVHYYGYHQRRMGCSGAADRFVYVDTDGDLHACPFCQRKVGSALHGALPASLAAVCQGGCHQFPAAVI